MTDTALMQLALEARKKAYAPYSGFKVGSALLGVSGEVYTGCNVENASYGATVCAERVAILKAVSQGESLFQALALAGGRGAETTFCTPCGLCRQTLAEFCQPDFKIIFLNEEQAVTVCVLGDLFPMSFNGTQLK